MRYTLSLLLLTAILFTGCRKRSFSPEGPTDVRIFNNTGHLIENVTVTTTDDDSYARRSFNYGSLSDGSYSEYHRFDIAFVKAEITLTIGSGHYTTEPVNFSYLTPMGQMRISYRVTIADQALHLLDIEVVPEEDIDDL